MIKNIVVKDNNFTCNLTFDNFDSYFNKDTLMDKYLPQNILSKIINLSTINNIQISYSNIEIYWFTQFYYKIFDLPYMNLCYNDL
jgi:hypothetical protein